MINDFFSHKIHSSGDEWQDKLIDIATIFAEFDGQPYNRDRIVERFKTISPRVSKVASDISKGERDISKFRDEISAYPAYLGLYHLELENDRWLFRLSETAKRFLIVEEPNVPAFMLLQLLLFQYPNGMGVRYYENGNSVVQANSRERTLELISDGIHVSPFRLICKALLADSQLNGINPHHPRVTIEEVFILANDDRTNKVASPSLEIITDVLSEIRSKKLVFPGKMEKRFHILNHTDFVQVTSDYIHLREAISPEDQESLIHKLNIINSIDSQFTGFDKVTDSAGLLNIINSGTWGSYFDGIVTLTAETVQGLTAFDITNFVPANMNLQDDDIVLNNAAIKFKYPLRERDGSILIQSNNFRKSQIADPEVTQIKRQRSNLQHKILIQKMDEHLRNIGAIPFENEHIDLFAKIPDDGTFIFEMKSVTSENLLSQTRKGLSQLYEYRYRYKDDVSPVDTITLCLVYPYEPSEIDWIQEYLCVDREIAICWFKDDQLNFPVSCSQKMRHLLQ